MARFSTYPAGNALQMPQKEGLAGLSCVSAHAVDSGAIAGIASVEISWLERSTNSETLPFPDLAFRSSAAFFSASWIRLIMLSSKARLGLHAFEQEVRRRTSAYLSSCDDARGPVHRNSALLQGPAASGKLPHRVRSTALCRSARASTECRAIARAPPPSSTTQKHRFLGK